MSRRRSRDWVGVVLQSRWRIDALIARGGFATVFRATHRLGQVAAIKILHPEFAQNEEVHRRFLREGYAANTVGHPGAVRVLDNDVADDGSPYIVMELLDSGELLTTRCEKRGGRLPYREVVEIAEQVLDVLAAAHDKGIIHRDIKPDNVFLVADGTIKVLDFGVAHIKEAAPEAVYEATRAGSVLGSLGFMSPEQARAQPGQLDPRSDVFSVGAMMFQLLSGQAVHPHEQATALFVATATRQARSLAEVGPRDLPRELVAIVDRALALDKDRRWDSARAMQSALRELLSRDAARRSVDPATAEIPRHPRDSSPSPAAPTESSAGLAGPRPSDTWTRPFADGDMEGPTVKTQGALESLGGLEVAVETQRTPNESSRDDAGRSNEADALAATLPLLPSYEEVEKLVQERRVKRREQDEAPATRASREASADEALAAERATTDSGRDRPRREPPLTGPEATTYATPTRKGWSFSTVALVVLGVLVAGAGLAYVVSTL